MSWLWSSRKDDDPLRNLTPEVRRALQQESPTNQSAGSAARQSERAAQTSDSLRPTDHYRTRAGFVAQDDDAAPVVPEQSLYQDGRYAHLWTSYRRPDQLETLSTNHDKLSLVVDSARQRQAEISRAALENCVFYQLAERECLENGSIKHRLTMCGTHSKASNRCYSMQSRFLKALGYAATDTSGADNDRIQLHAENLYQEMLERERVTAEAKEKGGPEPEFDPLLHAGSVGDKAPIRTEALALLGNEQLQQLDAKMGHLSPSDRDTELSLILADVKANMGFSKQIDEVFAIEKDERATRRARGQETLGDVLKRLWGWST